MHIIHSDCLEHIEPTHYNPNEREHKKSQQDIITYVSVKPKARSSISFSSSVGSESLL